MPDLLGKGLQPSFYILDPRLPPLVAFCGEIDDVARIGQVSGLENEHFARWTSPRQQLRHSLEVPRP